MRKLAGRVDIEPSYLSKIERDEQPPPGEGTIVRLAQELGEDPDVLLALAGKVPSDLLAIRRARPRVFADLLRELKKMPDRAVLRLVREVRDGDWRFSPNSNPNHKQAMIELNNPSSAVPTVNFSAIEGATLSQP